MNREYRIHWLGYEGGWGFVVQQKKRWWIFSWWEDVTEWMGYKDAEICYKKLTQ